MYLRNKLEESTNEDGFTLIEILVVILIIGILASIAIPVFLNQRKTAVDAAVISDVKNASMAMQTYFTNNPDSADYDITEIRKLVKKSSPEHTITLMGNANEYCVTGYAVNGKQFTGNTWLNGKQPYYVYSSVKGGGGQIAGGISGEICYPINRNML